ncbi:MAG: glycosyltransferase family 2 protein [Betaproteobacteria bacterium]|nr:glycosyltransferase family 2 protein [Betaproteobacteria bacterium]
MQRKAQQLAAQRSQTWRHSGTVITIAICTHNRSQLLDRTLGRLGEIAVPRRRAWEVLVVDNRCTDDTDTVLERHTGRLPLRRARQDRLGLSNARNAAMDHARGSYILWTDDDVLVDGNWLQAYEAAFDRHPDAAVFGGPIAPWFQSDPPVWIVENWDLLSSAYAARDLGHTAIPFNAGSNAVPYGANFCVRTDVQRMHRYDPALGRNGRRVVLGEEVDVVRRILAAGHEGWWVPEAGVRHWIPAERLSKRYVAEYFRGLGRTCSLTEPCEDAARWFGVPRWWYRELLERALRYAWCCPGGWTRDRVRALCDLETSVGRILAKWNT